MKEIQIKVTYNETKRFHEVLRRREFRVAYIQWLEDSAIFSIECQDIDEIESLEMLKTEFKITEII